MIDQGTVHAVNNVTLGSNLTADAAVSATLLVVDDPSDFNETGGTLSLNGLQYTYTAVDYDTDTIALSTGLTVAAFTADRVDVWPLTPEKQALVVVAGAGDALTVRVPHALVDRMSEGIRDEGARESVQFVQERGALVLTDVLGKDPVIEAQYLDPALTEALAANEAAIEELNTVTLPALQTELDGILPITATKIADDAITTPKIAANAVTANEIAANTITANEIAANTITANEMAADSITANEIAAGAIDGQTITGSWIRTAASGARISLNDPAYPNETVYYTNNPDETAPGRVRPVGAGGAALQLRGPDVTTVATPATLDLNANNATGESSVEVDADIIRLFATDFRVDGFSSLRLGDGSNYIKLAGHTIDAETGPLALVGTGATTSNGVPVVTTTGTQALTNKDLTDSSNTFVGKMLTDVQTAACTATSAALTTTEIDVTGCSITLTTLRPNARYVVNGSFYFGANTGGIGVATGKLNVDGTNQAGFANFTGATTLDRANVAQTWSGTLASAGSHTLKLRAVMSTTGGDFRFNAGSTALTVQIFE